MAGPNDPTEISIPADIAAQGEQATEAYRKIAEAQRDLTSSQQSSLGVMDLVSAGMHKIEDVAAQAGVSLNNLSALTDQQIEKFGLASAAALKARESFANFANVDYRGVATFGDHLKVIQDALDSGGTAAGQAMRAIDALADKYLNAGVKMDVINRAKRAGVDVSKALLGAVQAEASGIIAHADNMTRARTAYVQMAARVGELDDVVKAAGAGFANLDTIIERQKAGIRDTAEATGLTVQQTEQWYNQLGLIPGALKSVVDISEKGGRTQSMLSAAIQTAVGTGRSQEDVMKDLNLAFKDYGLVGEKALLFSVRMSDVSTRLRAPIDDVTTALRSSADAFKMFATGQESAAKSTESLAEMMNTYGKALESTGLSASQAVEVVSGLASGVSRLSIGQQAFISQQTGGPGGLMGAARQQLKTPGEQVKDAMDTLKKQFGQIVTVKDAAESEAAANQWVKQTAMLQQLLGPLAKDQQTANRILEAMKNQGEGNPDAIADALKPTGVQDAAAKGVDLQKQSNTILTDISHTLDAIRDLGDVGAGRIMGRNAAGATNTQRSTAEGRISAALSDRMRAAAERSGTRTTALANEMATGNVRATTGMDFGTTLHTTLGVMKDLPVAVEAMGQSIAGAFSRGDEDSAKKEEAQLEEFRRSRLEQARILQGNPEEQAKAQADANAAQRVQDAVKAAAGQAGARPPGSQVGTTARTVAGRPAAEIPGVTAPQGGTGTHVGPGGVPSPTGGQTINIVGKFSIDCPTCGRPHDVSPQAQIYPQQYKQG